MQVQRPTSPHLSIYRWQISSVLSILHRLSGVALAAGSLLMVAWLWVAAYEPSSYSSLHDALSSLPGRLCLLGWTAAFYYHLANGVRHLFWDIGQGFALPSMNRSGWMVLIFTALMTGATWYYVMTCAEPIA